MNKLAASIFLSLVCSNAYAGWFLSFGLGQVEFDDGIDQETQAHLASRGGYAFNDYFDIGVDLNLSVGSTKDDDDFNIQTSYFFIRTNLPIDNDYRLYLMAGVTHVELQNYTFVGNPVELKSQSGEGYGIGLQIPLKENNTYFAVEYINYLDEDEFDGESVDVTVDAINLRWVAYY